MFSPRKPPGRLADLAVRRGSGRSARLPPTARSPSGLRPDVVGGGPHPHRRRPGGRRGRALRRTPRVRSDRRAPREDFATARRIVRHGGVGDVASADIVVVQVDAIGPGGMVVDADDLGLIEAARAVEVPVWVEAGVGRVLPPRLWDALDPRARHRRPSPRAGVDGRSDRDRARRRVRRASSRAASGPGRHGLPRATGIAGALVASPSRRR